MVANALLGGERFIAQKASSERCFSSCFADYFGCDALAITWGISGVLSLLALVDKVSETMFWWLHVRELMFRQRSPTIALVMVFGMISWQ